MESLKKCLTIHLLLLAIFFWSGLAASQMIADITEDVETEFGIYHPYPVDVNPCVETYTIEPDFSNVVNFNDFTFSETDKALLLQNGFVVKPSHYKQIYDVYNECGLEDIPVFVTTDAVLHTFHILYDYMLRILEVRRFAQELDHLNKALLARSIEQYNAATDVEVYEAARRNVAYLTVGNALLDSSTIIPESVRSLVESELSLISAHSGFSSSPIFTYLEDYSQYVPRGHYTRNSILKRYFRSMMWYGRMTFAMIPEENWDFTCQYTRGALLLVQALNAIEIDDKPAMDVWSSIYDPTVFFVGKMDDLNIYQYTNLAFQIYGDDFLILAPDDIGQIDLLSAFVSAASQLPDPLIPSPMPGTTPKGFRFMGQRFIPDSYMFAQLVTPLIRGRLMPKGLDVMSVLGSGRAYQILDEVYHQLEYADYADKMDSLKVKFAALPDSTWAQNLYWNWLYCLMPLLFAKGEGYPQFMQNFAWQDKELATSLASWAELRHDTILYAKQSSSWESLPPQWLFAKGYVEPNPHLYARLAALARFMITGFRDNGLMLEEFQTKLEYFELLLLFLRDISIKELTNQPLTHSEYDLICHFGPCIEGLVTFSEEISGQIKNEADDKMAVVADVHTDQLNKLCLEEGVGFPLKLYVILAVEETVKVTEGSVFSYYEFPQPISDRLTDEAWQDIQTGSNPKPLPVWVGSFVDLGQEFPHDYEPYNLYRDETEVNFEVSSFSALECQRGVKLQWVTEGNISHFNLYKGKSENSNERYRLNCGPVLENQFLDEDVSVGQTYYYWLEAIGLSGSNYWYGPVSITMKHPTPQVFALIQNYPNPFNPVTLIKYDLPVDCQVKLEIYNILGRRVANLVDGQQKAGYKRATWNACDFASGIYFYRLKAGNFTSTRKMVLLR